MAQAYLTHPGRDLCQWAFDWRPALLPPEHVRAFAEPRELRPAAFPPV